MNMQALKLKNNNDKRKNKNIRWKRNLFTLEVSFQAKNLIAALFFKESIQKSFHCIDNIWEKYHHIFVIKTAWECVCLCLGLCKKIIENELENFEISLLVWVGFLFGLKFFDFLFFISILKSLWFGLRVAEKEMMMLLPRSSPRPHLPPSSSSPSSSTQFFTITTYAVTSDAVNMCCEVYLTFSVHLFF